jgi:hypothetical protein
MRDSIAVRNIWVAFQLNKTEDSEDGTKVHSRTKIQSRTKKIVHGSDEQSSWNWHSVER